MKDIVTFMSKPFCNLEKHFLNRKYSKISLKSPIKTKNVYLATF